MTVLVLFVVLALAVVGVVCVVWAEQGGPRWVRVVAGVTLGVSQLLRSARKQKRRGGGGNTSGDC